MAGRVIIRGALVAMTLATVGVAADLPPILIDPCDDPASWSAHPADGVTMAIVPAPGEQGQALGLEFAFSGGGWAIARREVDLTLPEDYVIRFRLRGDAPPNTLELKLIDRSGENVWWRVWRDVAWPDQWTTFQARKRQISFAWGPLGGGDPTHVAAIELAVTAGEGGAGTVWIDQLELVPREPVHGPPPEPLAAASSAADGHAAGLALDGDPASAWRPADDDPRASLTLDLGRLREFGGLVVDWATAHHGLGYRLDAAEEPGRWATLLTVAGSNGGRDLLPTPDAEARYLRLTLADLPGGALPALAEVQLQPLAWTATREAMLMDVATSGRRGLYPRGMSGEQSYWTVVGVDHDPLEGLLNEDGALESGPGGFSVEPFLWHDGRLLTWADVTSEATLADGNLPVPTVTWQAGTWQLRVTATASGPAGASLLQASYQLTNTGGEPQSATLYLAVRPFQVNPPSQWLNIRGGTSTIEALSMDGTTLLVNDRPAVVLLEQPDAAGASTFHGGDVVADHLAHGRLPTGSSVRDGMGLASGAVAYTREVGAGQRVTFDLLLPLHAGADVATLQDPDEFARAAAAAVESWRAARDRVTLQGPPAAADVLATVQAQLGYILVNRAGPAIQPGARAYARSWIRDGALTGEALVRLGHGEAARAFLEWFAVHQYDSGKIPCVVDRRGADPVPEHDSTGEFIALVAMCYRDQADRDLLDRMWPRVLRGIDYLESLLEQRRQPQYRTPEQREFFGILPPSISHEGYAARPMHSYWDNFWTLRGYRDAIWLADQLVAAGVDSVQSARGRLAAQRDRFAADLAASIAAAMQRHGIDYVPGCADLGDFDPTSTTIALAPAAAGHLLPPGSLERTFERYWEFARDRRDGAPWEAMTPYEVRTIGTFVRLGWRERASELLDIFLALRRPAGWRHWAEVVSSTPREPRFLGDMPHTWVGSDFVRSVLDMIAYPQWDDDGDVAQLVLAAGVPAAWLDDGGLRVADLPTPCGPLGYTLARQDGAVVMTLQAGLTVPAGGLSLRPPTRATSATVDGRPWRGPLSGGVVVHQVPTTVRWLE